MSIPHSFDPLGVLAGEPPLPQGYTRVPWLTSDGTQHIDTRFNPSSIDRWDGRAAGSAGYHGCIHSNLNPTRRFSFDISANYGVRCQYGATAAADLLRIENYDGNPISWSFDRVSRIVRLGNKSASFAGFQSPSVTIGLFARHTNYNAFWDFAFVGRLFYSKIWAGGKLVQWLVPVRRNMDGVYLLLDLVTGAEFSSPVGNHFTIA